MLTRNLNSAYLPRRWEAAIREILLLDLPMLLPC